MTITKNLVNQCTQETRILQVKLKNFNSGKIYLNLKVIEIFYLIIPFVQIVVKSAENT